MKIYTRTGDDGSTGLFGGGRVSKNDPCVELFGAIDELNAAVGLACVEVEKAAPELAPLLRRVQSELFTIGSQLSAAPGANRDALPDLDESASSRFETEIDGWDKSLPPLRNFILPGGSESAARLHMARTICRRAERMLVGFAATHDVASSYIVYLNRLSDWLFTMARQANHRAGVQDVPWVVERK